MLIETRKDVSNVHFWNDPGSSTVKALSRSNSTELSTSTDLGVSFAGDDEDTVAEVVLS